MAGAAHGAQPGEGAARRQVLYPAAALAHEVVVRRGRGGVAGRAPARARGEEGAAGEAGVPHGGGGGGRAGVAPGPLRLGGEADVLAGRYLLRRLPPRLEGRRHAELAANLERHVLVDADEAVQPLPQPALVLGVDEQRPREPPRAGGARAVDRQVLAA